MVQRTVVTSQGELQLNLVESYAQLPETVSLKEFLVYSYQNHLMECFIKELWCLLSPQKRIEWLQNCLNSGLNLTQHNLRNRLRLFLSTNIQIVKLCNELVIVHTILDNSNQETLEWFKFKSQLITLLNIINQEIKVVAFNILKKEIWLLDINLDKKTFATILKGIYEAKEDLSLLNCVRYLLLCMQGEQRYPEFFESLVEFNFNDKIYCPLGQKEQFDFNRERLNLLFNLSYLNAFKKELK